MAIDFITETPVLPRIDKDARKPEEIVNYLIRLVTVLQEDLLRTITVITNNQLSLMNVGIYYFSLPDENGEYADNTWRMILNNSGVEIQKKISGTWTMFGRWEE